MPDRILIRGDSYAVRRPLYRTQFFDTDGQPFNLTGCVVRTTYRAATVAPDADPNDDEAIIRHTLDIDGDGSVVIQDGLFLVGPPTGGLVEERFSSVETRSLPLGIRLLSDIELTDAAGEVITWIMQEGITSIDAYTNRTA